VARALESSCLGILCFKMCLTAAAAAAAAAVQQCSLRVRIHGEARAECASLGL